MIISASRRDFIHVKQRWFAISMIIKKFWMEELRRTLAEAQRRLEMASNSSSVQPGPGSDQLGTSSSSSGLQSEMRSAFPHMYRVPPVGVGPSRASGRNQPYRRNLATSRPVTMDSRTFCLLPDPSNPEFESFTPSPLQENELMMAGLGTRNIEYSNGVGYNEIRQAVETAYPKLRPLNGRWTLWKTSCGGSGRRKLCNVPYAQDLYTAESIRKNISAKSTVYIIPIQDTLDSQPLGAEAEEFKALPKAPCAKCNVLFPVPLLTLHAQKCDAPSTSSRSDDMPSYETRRVGHGETAMASRAGTPEPSSSTTGSSEQGCIVESIEHIAQIFPDVARCHIVDALEANNMDVQETVLALLLRSNPVYATRTAEKAADINIPEVSESGNLHGMPLGFLANGSNQQKNPARLPGHTWIKDPRVQMHNLAYIGLRDVDDYEVELLQENDVLAFYMDDVRRLGIKEIMRQIYDKFQLGPNKKLHLSFDIDGMDPSVAPSTGTTASGGLSLDEGLHIVQAVHNKGFVELIDMVEVNPTLGDDQDARMTVGLASLILQVAMGIKSAKKAKAEFLARFKTETPRQPQ